VTDLVETTHARLAALAPQSIDAVRARRQPLVGLSLEVAAEHQELKAFLRRSLYRHERVLAMNRRAQGVVIALFGCFMNDVRAMPEEHARKAIAAERADGEAGRARAVADYIAGMTDRYAIAAYRRLIDQKLDW
jgi:dGTPase